MNEFGKICVVFVTAASLAFVAFTGAMRSGGRNWQAEADELGPDYILTITPGDKTSYSITHRPKNKAIPQSPLLSEVVVKAREMQVAEAEAEIKKWNDLTQEIKPKTEAILAAITADEQGLTVRQNAMTKQLEAVNQEIARINTQINDAALEAQKIRSEGQERREEVYRLRNQLELLRNDLFVAQVQRQNLEEEEIRLREILQRLERRQQQLAGKSDYAG